MRSRRPRRTETRTPRRHHRTPEDSHKHNPGLLLFSLPLLSLESARLWMCVASPNADAARGDAAQAAFLSKNITLPKRIPDLGAQGIVCRPQVWTADGRPHAAVTRSLQYSPVVASCRNGQQTSAKAFQHRWKFEIQIALLRRGATMTRAVLPDASVREQWPLTRLMDRATSHWIRAPPLDGEENEGSDNGTDTTAPDDDNDDIASCTSQQTTAIHTQACSRSTRAAAGASGNPTSGAASLFNGPACAGTQRPA